MTCKHELSQWLIHNGAMFYMNYKWLIYDIVNMNYKCH